MQTLALINIAGEAHHQLFAGIEDQSALYRGENHAVWIGGTAVSISVNYIWLSQNLLMLTPERDQ